MVVTGTSVKKGHVSLTFIHNHNKQILVKLTLNRNHDSKSVKRNDQDLDIPR